MSQRAAKAAEEQSEPSAVMERLSWQLAYRDDAQVGQALYAGAEIEEMHDTPRGGVAGRVFCVRGASGDDGGVGAGAITRSATGAGADGAVCTALYAQGALWGPVDERIAALAGKSMSP